MTQDNIITRSMELLLAADSLWHSSSRECLRGNASNYCYPYHVPVHTIYSCGIQSYFLWLIPLGTAIHPSSSSWGKSGWEPSTFESITETINLLFHFKCRAGGGLVEDLLMSSRASSTSVLQTMTSQFICLQLTQQLEPCELCFGPNCALDPCAQYRS